VLNVIDDVIIQLITNKYKFAPNHFHELVSAIEITIKNISGHVHDNLNVSKHMIF
jgi:hypothetical protein